MRRPDFDAGGGTCRHCGTRLPAWDCREHCDSCLGECYEADHRDDEQREDDE